MSREVQNEHEMLTNDDDAVSRLVGGLKHAEAPANFERRVMAKIAEGRPQQRGFFVVPLIGIAVPALLVLLIGTFFIFRSRQSAVVQPGPVAANETVNEQASRPPAIPTHSVEPATVAQDQQQSQVPPSDTLRKSVQTNRATNINRGGSYDEALPNKKQPLPEGIDPGSRTAVNRGEVMTSAPIPVKDMLINLGMSVEYANGWQVKSINENGAAQKTGIKVGDMIKALDDRSIDSSTTFQGFGSFHSVTVSRDGKLIPLKLVLR